MDERDIVRQRAREAAHLQLIEGNPFDAEDIAMFEMFDREGFSPEDRRNYILEQSRKRTASAAAKLSTTAAE
jgi:hypothetical protein